MEHEFGVKFSLSHILKGISNPLRTVDLNLPCLDAVLITSLVKHSEGQNLFAGGFQTPFQDKVWDGGWHLI